MIMRRHPDGDQDYGVITSAGGGVVTAEAEPAATLPAKPEASFLQRVAHMELTPKKVPRRDLMQFSRQLAVFIRAGIPILDALEIINSETKDKFFHAILTDITEALRGGATLADAFAPHQDAFPPYYLGILRSAELTGSLDSALVKLSDYIERDVEARRKIVSALVYPAIIAVMSLGVVIVLVTFVLPRFEKFFQSLDAKLPLPTRMLLSIAHFVSTYWYLILGGIVLMLCGLLYLTQVERGKATRDKILLKLPVIGDMVQHAVLERFCRILNSMVVTGVPLPEAMVVTASAVNNRVYRDAIMRVREAMLRGEGIATPIAETGLFPAAARQMVRVGEATGSLDEQLEIAAGFYDQELDYRIKRFTSLFEPFVIVFMGLVVGFVAIALVSAMYGIYRQVHIK